MIENQIDPPEGLDDGSHLTTCKFLDTADFEDCDCGVRDNMEMSEARREAFLENSYMEDYYARKYGD